MPEFSKAYDTSKVTSNITATEMTTKHWELVYGSLKHKHVDEKPQTKYSVFHSLAYFQQGDLNAKCSLKNKMFMLNQGTCDST